MRRLLLLVSALVMISCGARGTIEEIDHVLQDGNYKIECEFQGCFGEGTAKLEIKNSKTATYTFLDFSQENGPVEKTKIISWTKEKDKKVKEFFETAIHLHDTSALCTTTAKYVLTSWRNSIEFEDLNCKLAEKFEELVK